MDNLDNFSNFIFYQSEDGSIQVQVIVDNEKETIWATQKSIAEVFQTSRENITIHLKNIFESNELDEKSVSKENLHTASDGKKYKTKFYNLDAIISVGYRVNSIQATQFRKWATSVLNEYLRKGFVLNDDRLKRGSQLFGKDYFAELLERIREIRASERMFYQKITDIYATSIDYDSHSPITHEFYATVQNKLHWAIHHHTAAELIKLRADSKKENMGLTSYKNEKKGGKVLKSDVTTAKNYLNEEEIKELNRVVTMYLDFAENMAERNREMKMVDWVIKLDNFLSFNEYDLLKDTGSISAKMAKTFAEKEYEKYRVLQDKEYKSDFDKTVEEVKSTGKIPQYSKFSIKKYLMDLEQDKPTEFDKNLKQAINFNPKDED